VVGAVTAVSLTLAALAAPAAAAPGTVTLRLGEDLTMVAAANHTTVAALAAANGIADPNRVDAGTILRLPGPTPAALAAPSTANGAPQSVVVALGQNLTQIAASHHTTVAALVAANGIADPNHVKAGAILRLPGPTMAPASYTTPVPPTGAAVPTGAYPAALLAHPSRLSLLPLFHDAATAAGIPASLLEALCWWESGWQSNVVSPTGAVGVCQIEPATTAFIETVLLHNTTLHPAVAAQNIELAAALLRYLLEQTGGDEHLALGAYYAGLSAVVHHGLSPATQNYVTGVSAYAAIFAAAG